MLLYSIFLIPSIFEFLEIPLRYQKWRRPRVLGDIYLAELGPFDNYFSCMCCVHAWHLQNDQRCVARQEYGTSEFFFWHSGVGENWKEQLAVFLLPVG